MSRSPHHSQSGSSVVVDPPCDATFVARLVFPTGHGLRSLIVECHRDGNGLTIHLPEFNEATNYLDDTTVSVTSVQAESTDSAQAVIGHSRLIDDHDVAAGAAAALERWSGSEPAHYFQITPAAPAANPLSWPYRQGRCVDNDTVSVHRARSSQ